MSRPADVEHELIELDNGAVALSLQLDIRHVSTLPTEIRLFGAGVTETTKGPIVYDETAGAMVLEAFEAGGLDMLPFDANHGMLAKGAHPDASKALGWFRPEVRNDGLYAAGIEWTESGAAALQKREYRFFSPAVMLEDETKRVSQLINVALTNLPATRGQRPLVANETYEDIDEMKQLLKALNASDEASGVASVARLTGLAAVAQELGEDPGAVRAALVTLRDQAAQATQLAQRVAELEAAATEAQRDALIRELSEAGKLPPSLHGWARTIDYASLSAFGAAAPVAATAGIEQPVVADADVSLSDTEIAVSRQLGLSKEDFLKARTAMRGDQ